MIEAPLISTDWNEFEAREASPIRGPFRPQIVAYLNTIEIEEQTLSAIDAERCRLGYLPDALENLMIDCAANYLACAGMVSHWCTIHRNCFGNSPPKGGD